MLYANCRELPIHNFNEINITGNLDYLIKDKTEHSEEDLQAKWIDIYDEYTSLVSEDSGHFRKQSEIIYLEIKLQALLSLQKLSLHKLSDEQQKEFDVLMKKYRVKNLDREAKSLIDKINIKKNQLESKDNSQKNSNFDEALAIMRMNGYSVDRYTMTVAEWCALIKSNDSRNK